MQSASKEETRTTNQARGALGADRAEIDLPLDLPEGTISAQSLTLSHLARFRLPDTTAVKEYAHVVL